MSEIDIRTVSVEDLARLKRNREEADARYNEALTAVDRAVQSPPDLPPSPTGLDEFQVTPLNTRWDILATRPAFSGWRGRVAAAVWGVVEPLFARQQQFNSALVDHINRNVASSREMPLSLAATIGVVRQLVEESIRFQATLVVYLQKITPYVDTKDYEVAGLARRRVEDVSEEAARLDTIARGLAGGLHGLSDEVVKRYESLATSDHRQAQGLDQLRTAFAAVHQLTTALQRHVESVASAGAAVGALPAPAGPGVATTAANAQQLRAQDPLRSHLYAGFEDLYRGSEDEIRDRMRDYVERFRGATDVLDVGCGRGEFLELLRDAGIPAHGIDLNVEMVERCRVKGLDVRAGDALSYLSGLDDASLGGVIACQVVEHLQPDDLLRFIELARQRLRPGGIIVLETINPASWSAFFDSYVRDLTHVRPVHPDTLRYLLVASGFLDAEIVWRSPYPEQSKLARLATGRTEGRDPDLDALVKTLDRNTDRLNALMFGPYDFAAVARRP